MTLWGRRFLVLELVLGIRLAVAVLVRLVWVGGMVMARLGMTIEVVVDTGQGATFQSLQIAWCDHMLP